MLLQQDLTCAQYRYSNSIKLNLIGSSVFLIIIAATFISSATLYFDKARVSEALVQMTELKNNIMSDYYYLGHWPESKILYQFESDKKATVREITFDGKGTINVFFSDHYPALSKKILSFSAAHTPQFEPGNLLWVCGYTAIPPNFKNLGNNITTIDPQLLPRTCK